MNNLTCTSLKPSLKDGKLELLLIFVPCFVLLFAIAVLGRLVGLHWQTWLPGSEQKTSLISGVHAAVYTFMSHII
jgi:light-harvesting complex 1 beta chain